MGKLTKILTVVLLLSISVESVWASQGKTKLNSGFKAVRLALWFEGIQERSIYRLKEKSSPKSKEKLSKKEFSEELKRALLKF